MITKDPVGDNLYLFRDASRTASHLVIFTHGGYNNSSGQVAVPAATNLIFYGPHDRLLSDLPLKDVFLQTTIRPYETIAGGANVCDYTVSKYKACGGLWASHKTYQAIQGDFDYQQDSGVPMDVLTVRNRGGRLFAPTVTLSTVFNELQKNRLHYRSIHCVFCRGRNASAPGHSAYSNGRHA